MISHRDSKLDTKITLVTGPTKSVEKTPEKNRELRFFLFAPLRQLHPSSAEAALDGASGAFEDLGRGVVTKSFDPTEHDDLAEGRGEFCDPELDFPQGFRLHRPFIRSIHPADQGSGVHGIDGLVLRGIPSVKAAVMVVAEVPSDPIEPRRRSFH